MSVSLRIKFRCSHCQKPLSIGRKKAGATVTCPKCKKKITVPEDNELMDREDSEENPFEEFQVFDDEFDEPELVYSEEEKPGAATRTELNDRLSVSRKMVYFQGALLGIVAILFFLLGLVVGSSTQSKPSSEASVKSNVKGIVLLDDNTADEGAVVFLLPTNKRPASRFESEELLPGRTFTSANPEVPLIRRFGGNVCTANQAGQFQLTVAPDQEYVLFVVSANARRNRELDSEYHSTVGHYFTSLENMTEGRICFYKKVMPRKTNENLGKIVLKTEG